MGRLTFENFIRIVSVNKKQSNRSIINILSFFALFLLWKPIKGFYKTISKPVCREVKSFLFQYIFITNCIYIVKLCNNFIKLFKFIKDKINKTNNSFSGYLQEIIMII